MLQSATTAKYSMLLWLMSSDGVDMSTAIKLECAVVPCFRGGALMLVLTMSVTAVCDVLHPEEAQCCLLTGIKLAARGHQQQERTV